MDDKTITSLTEAFKAAPSAALAKILVFAYLKKNDLNTAIQYLPHLQDDLEQEELSLLVKHLLQANEHDALMDYGKKLTQVASLHELLQQLLTQGAFELSKQLYLFRLKQDPMIKTPDFERQFGNESERPKLRVIEKTNTAEVTQLSRYREQVTTFNDVVGLDKIKKQIHKKIILPFQKPSLFQRFKKKIGGGVLLFGPPGCGKTLLARATAGECGASFFNVEVSDVLDMYIGESEQKLRAIFEKARQEAPSVLFFDELEALAGKREHSRNTNTSNIVSQFLTELDGFSQNNEGVLVLASTNVPWAVDTAFLRPGRFDRMFFVPPPDVEARASILKHHMLDRPQTGDIDLDDYAKKTPGFSGADLSNLVESAADEAIDESIETGNETLISAEHFKVAFSDCRPTTTEWLTTARNYARYANDGGRYNDVLDFMKQHGKA